VVNLRQLSVLFLMALVSANSAAQTYPSKPIRMVVPNAAGGGMDFLARTVSAPVSQALAQPIIVDNKPGAATAVGASEVARAAPDGYTILIADGGTLVFNPMMYSKLIYDPARQLTPVSMLARFPMILVVGPSVQQKSAIDFIQFARTNPSGVTFGSPGVGSPHHLAMELLKRNARFDALHVPYKGAAPSVQGVAAGEISAMMVDMAAGAGMIKSGKIRPLAVASPKRLAQLPNVPTFAELGMSDIEAAAVVGVAAPAGTPPEVVSKLEQQFIAAVTDPQTRARLVEFGVEPVGSTSAEYAKSLVAEKSKWEKLIADLKISLE